MVGHVDDRAALLQLRHAVYIAAFEVLMGLLFGCRRERSLENQTVAV
jgi:hypothetical protein